MATLAIHLVWTTYGTWLPGDDRGSWSPLLDLYGHLKTARHQLSAGDENTRRLAEARMTQPAKILSPAEIAALSEILGHQATQYSPAFTPGRHSPTITSAMTGGLGKSVRDSFEQPRILAAAIEAAHTHLLVGTLKEHVSKYVGRLKGTTASALLKRPENAGRKGIWTAGYWKGFLFDVPDVVAVRDYVEQHNERAGRPRHAYEWVEPREDQ